MSETKSKGKQGTAARVLMPVIATLASATASYLAKKAPQYLEQTVLPKLRETKDSTGSVGDVAHDLAERAKSAVGSGDEQIGGDSPRSTDELEKRRRERAEHRAARRKAS